jgi:hypothetical protein
MITKYDNGENKELVMITITIMIKKIIALLKVNYNVGSNIVNMIRSSEMTDL